MENPSDIIDDLNKKFQIYTTKFSKQFHLQIPKNTLNTVQFYRDSYFPFLKNSIYKSNICYLMQLIDYQIWLYKVFKPGLSLENALFYQLLITMGIISEALATAILLNPIIDENNRDVSLGKVNDTHKLIHDRIVKNQFQNNISLITKFKLLPTELIEKFTKIRIDIRNMIHIQNWDGRLYQQLSIDKFSADLEEFRIFLGEVKSNVKINHTPEHLNLEFFEISQVDSQKTYTGIIIQFDSVKGFGFIKSESFQRSIYFHRSNSVQSDREQLQSGVTVNFKLIEGKKGIEASIQ
ncbi:MAG: cold shock domain-containing protein [Spirochaetia bacterium]|nr:cold shock domain-containing protein [Spirochaetia bacterium]